MGERPSPEQSMNSDVRRERELSRLQSRAGDFLHLVYQQGQDNDERLEKLQANLAHYIEHMGEAIDAKAVQAGIEACRSAPDEETFVNTMISIIHPILEHQVDHPDIARRIFMDRHDFTPLNEVLSFGITEDGEVAHIHLAPAMDISNLRSMVIAGLQELARRIQSEPETFGRLTRVAATSWIIAEHPKVMERLGFTIDGPASGEAVDQAREGGETREMLRAHMDRETFLTRYST